MTGLSGATSRNWGIDNNEIKIVNPISSDLNVLRNSIFPNLIFYLKKNIDRGFKDLSFFEIGPVFSGTKPGEQLTVIGALQAGKYFRLNWQEKERNVDVFDAKRDTVQTVVEAGFNKNKLIKLGWKVIDVWECTLKRKNIDKTFNILERLIIA